MDLLFPIEIHTLKAMRSHKTLQRRYKPCPPRRRLREITKRSPRRTRIIKIPAPNRNPRFQRRGLQRSKLLVQINVVGVRGSNFERGGIDGRESGIQMRQTFDVDVFWSDAVALALADVG